MYQGPTASVEPPLSGCKLVLSTFGETCSADVEFPISTIDDVIGVSLGIIDPCSSGGIIRVSEAPSLADVEHRVSVRDGFRCGALLWPSP